jgi:hypothetical protein
MQNLLIKAFATDKGINITNMFLMFIAVILAYLLPFKMFLFAYAVLGPLHYLTEISWLEKKNYFLEKKYDIWVFILLALLLTFALFDKDSKAGKFTTTYVITGFAFAVLSYFIKSNPIKYGLTVVVFLLSFAIKADKSLFYFLAFGVMLPTLIHVFLFTGLFIFYGALKSKSKTGILSAAIFIICSLSFFYFKLPQSEIVTQSVRDTMRYFLEINNAFARIFMDWKISDYSLFFETDYGIAIQRFVAFAYTYHYLNWFSKTTVIKWHEVSRKRMAVILFLWIISVVLYYYDYHTGFMALFFLSFLHVFFEFPLNIHTIRGIGREFKGILSKSNLS